MDKIKQPKWWDEFTAFAIKGNAMALAVGTIIGAAFSTITKSLTDDVIMPIVSIFIGGVDFSEMKLVLPRLFTEKYDEAGNVIENTLNYGNFISAVINFLILALVVFFLVKGLNKLSEVGKKKEEEKAEEAKKDPEPTKEELLLTEIRDLLKEKYSIHFVSPKPKKVSGKFLIYRRQNTENLGNHSIKRIFCKNGLTNWVIQPIINTMGANGARIGSRRFLPFLWGSRGKKSKIL